MARIVYGIHPVIELIRAKPQSVIEVRFVDSGNPALADLCRLAAKHRVRIGASDKNGLARFAGTPDHQGAAASARPYEYAEVEEMLADAKEAGEEPLRGARQRGPAQPRIDRAVGVLPARTLFFPRDRAAQVTPVSARRRRGGRIMKIAAVSNRPRARSWSEGGGLGRRTDTGAASPARPKLPVCLSSAARARRCAGSPQDVRLHGSIRRATRRSVQRLGRRGTPDSRASRQRSTSHSGAAS